MQDKPTVKTTILIKRRLRGNPGPPEKLASGELAFNETTGVLYIGTQTPSVSAMDI